MKTPGWLQTALILGVLVVMMIALIGFVVWILYHQG